MFLYTNRKEVKQVHNPTMRVLQILSLVSGSSQGMRLSDISRILDIPKSTLLPILQTMVQSRYLFKDETDRYSPGIAMTAMSASSGNELSSTQQIRRCLEQLVDRFRETCYFGVLEKGQVFYLEKVESPNPLRMLTSTGHRLPAYATGLGKALLLDKTETEIRKLYPEGLRPLTENTVADIPSLMKQLEEAKFGGYTWEVQESTEHIRCFGVPVRIRGKIEGAISIAIPLFRYDPAEKEALVQALQESAKILEMILQKTGIDR